MHDPTFWLIARATGIQAVALLGGTMIAGLALKGRPVTIWKGADITDVHRFLSLLALMAVGVHGVALYLDETIEVSPLALVVPGLVPYREFWTGMGVVTAELMLLIHLSFRLRKRMGMKAWRRVHYLTYLAFAGGVLHGLLSGTDSAQPWALLMYTGLVATVIGLTVWRATQGLATRRARPAPTAARRPPAPVLEES